MNAYILETSTCDYCGKPKSQYLNGDQHSGYSIVCLSCGRYTSRRQFSKQGCIEAWERGDIKTKEARDGNNSD